MKEAFKQSSKRFCTSPRIDEARLRSVLDHISDGYLTVDRDLKISDINSAAARWVGSPVEDLLGRDFFEAFDRAAVIEQRFMADLIASGLQQKLEISSRRYPGRWVEVHFYPSDRETMILFRDVTERKNAELAGEKARDLLYLALDGTSSEIAILDETGCILVANQAWHRFMADAGGFHRDNGIGAFYLELRTLRPVKTQLQSFRSGIQAVLAGAHREFNFNFRTRVRGSFRSYRLRVARMDFKNWGRVLVAREDVTELETALSDVDNMAVRLVNLQEKERQRYAAELHDSTVQHLTAASLNLMVLRNSRRGDSKDALVAAVEESLSEAQREIRSVSYLLYPKSLDEDGLHSTLRRFTSGYASRTQITASLTARGPIDGLAIGMQRSVLRIVQEAMANVHRHANASCVRIIIRADQRRLSISVVDNGKGLAKSDDGKILQPGVGISGMKARAHQLGGCLKLRSAGKGTLVFVRIPLFPQSAGNSVSVLLH